MGTHHVRVISFVQCIGDVASAPYRSIAEAFLEEGFVMHSVQSSSKTQYSTFICSRHKEADNCPTTATEGIAGPLTIMTAIAGNALPDHRPDLR